MQRLPFTLPPFTRTSWVNDNARDVWAPRLQRIARAWQEVEWRTVVAGLRPCAAVFASPEEFLTRGAEWAAHGLNALPVGMQAATGGYVSATVAARLGQPFLFRFVLGTPKDVIRFKAAWDDGDNAVVGQLLGYPDCCQAFFHDVWVEQGLTDTTWPMARATLSAADEPGTLDVDGPPETNLLWRWQAVRAVPHLPCRFDCPESLALARAFLQVGRDSGYADEMAWLLEILSWPAEWSALHGIAEIKTPILKTSAQTDATPCRYAVRWRGTSFPAEGARGLTFPFQAPRMLWMTASPGYHRGLRHPIPVLNGSATELARSGKAHEAS